MQTPEAIWTIGHSTRSLEQFVGLLKHYRLEAVADVRRHPGSRRLPQFGEEALHAGLADHGIDYLWVPGLGGRRRASPDSPNKVWRNASFRGYADHLHTTEFAEGLDQLLTLASRYRTTMMCAELLWWRCHRALVSDVLKVRGVDVLHVQDERRLTPHPYTSPARLIDGKLSYVEAGGEPLGKYKS